jgi:hypothetical protein
MFFNRALVVCAAMAAMIAPSALADEWNRATYFTFNRPLEVPGQVLLPGSYTFRLLDSPTDRNIVAIYNRDQTRLYAILFAVPDFRLDPPSRPEVTLEERSATSPQAIGAWWYPGEQYGEHFVYWHAPTVHMNSTAELSLPGAAAAPAD